MIKLLNPLRWASGVRFCLEVNIVTLPQGLALVTLKNILVCWWSRDPFASLVHFLLLPGSALLWPPLKEAALLKLRWNSHNWKFTILMFLQPTLQWVLACSQCCAAIRTNSWTFHHCEWKLVTILCRLPTPPSSPGHYCVFCLCVFAYFGFACSCKWNHIINEQCDWLLSMFSKFIRVVACIGLPFLYPTEYYCIIWIDHILGIHSSVNGHLDYFHFLLLWIILLWVFVYKFLFGYAFSSLGYIPKRRIAGSYGISMFNFLRNCQRFPRVFSKSRMVRLLSDILLLRGSWIVREKCPP